MQIPRPCPGCLDQNLWEGPASSHITCTAGPLVCPTVSEAHRHNSEAFLHIRGCVDSTSNTGLDLKLLRGDRPIQPYPLEENQAAGVGGGQGGQRRIRGCFSRGVSGTAHPWRARGPSPSHCPHHCPSSLCRTGSCQLSNSPATITRFHREGLRGSERLGIRSPRDLLPTPRPGRAPSGPTASGPVRGEPPRQAWAPRQTCPCTSSLQG